MKPILNAQLKKKNEARKAKKKKRGGEKAKNKSQDFCVTLNPKTS